MNTEKCSQPVTDAKAEKGITIQNVLTIFLGVIMGGVWNSVINLEGAVNDVSKIQSAQGVWISSYDVRISGNASDIKAIETILNNHIAGTHEEN